MTELQTPRLKLRLLNEDDAPMILSLLNQPSFLKNIGDKKVRNLKDATDYINNGPLKLYHEAGYCMYCCERLIDGKTIGLSGLIKRDGIAHVEVGFSFLEQFQHQGYGSESLQAVIKHAQQTLNLGTLNAITNPANIASIGLLTKHGFVQEGQVTLPEGDLVNLYYLAQSSSQ